VALMFELAAKRPVIPQKESVAKKVLAVA